MLFSLLLGCHIVLPIQGSDISDRLRFMEAEFTTWHKRILELHTVPIRKGYTLAVYTIASGLPDQHMLVLEKGKSLKPIFNLDALKGIVQIDIPAEAVRFVRLKISPSSNYFVTPWGPNDTETMMEILTPAGYKQKAMEFNVSHDPDWTILNDGFAGVVQSKSLARFVSPYPIVRPSVQGFEITRMIVVINGGLYKPELIHEFVGKNGSYKLLSESTVPNTILKGVRWFVPLRG